MNQAEIELKQRQARENQYKVLSRPRQCRLKA